MATVDIDLGKYQLGWSDEEDYVFKPRKGLNEEILREMSAMKGEPDWMLAFRLKADEEAMQSGFADNLIVEAFREFTPKQREGKPARKKRRVSMGVFPAIPIEIVP